ncbi:MAG: DUF4160 domain-containing protein [Chloroflexi bacterium]|nr:DUF4160 domain-containing protein [Chloroflexota bacterium]
MPTISRFYGIVIQMYFDEEHGPHFHAIYSGQKAQISALDGTVMGGKLPPRVLRHTDQWYKLHRAELLENWERARRREKLKRIEGLP